MNLFQIIHQFMQLKSMFFAVTVRSDQSFHTGSPVIVTILPDIVWEKKQYEISFNQESHYIFREIPSSFCDIYIIISNEVLVLTCVWINV